ncbi:MAG: O-antigen ligase family protein [Thermoleophilia bacterium]
MIAAAGAVLLMPLVYVPQLYQIHSIPKVTVFRLAVVVMLGAWALRLLAGTRRGEGRGAAAGERADRRLVPGLRLPDLFFATFLIWLGFTAAASDHPGAALLGLSPRYEGFLGFVGYGAFYWTAARATTVQARSLLRALTASATVLAALALLEMLGPFRPPGFDAFGARAVSTLGNPVFVGAWLALSLPGAFALLALSTGTHERAAIIASMAPQAAALYLTTARGSWVGAAFGLTVALALAATVAARPGRAGARWRRRALTIITASTVIVLLAVAVVGIARPTVTAGAGARLGEAVAVTRSEPGGSVETRLLMWRATAGLVAERPLIGAGLESFLADFPRVRPLGLVRIEGADAYPDRPHNHLLYLAFSGGVPALILYLLFLGSVFVMAVSVVLRTEGPWQRRLALCGLVGAVAAYEVQALFSFSIPWVTACAACMQGLIVALAGTRRPAPSASSATATVRETRPRRATGRATLATRPATRRTLGSAAGVLLLLVALPFFTETLRQTWADVDFARARSQPWEALRLTERAVRLSSRDSDYVLGRGDVLERAAALPGSAALLDQAAALYRTAQDRIPAHPDIGFSLARVLAGSGDTRDALVEYDSIVARDPYHAGALFNLAVLSLQTGDPARAVAPLATLTSFAPADAEAWYYLGSAYEGIGDTAKAIAAYGRAVTAAPGFPEAAEALERLEP